MRRILLGLLIIIVSLVVGIPSFISWLSPAKIKPGDTMVRLYVHETGQTLRLDLDDYVLGVAAAEMPANFPPEALKAQAVAARTYIMKRMVAGGVSNALHSDVDACDDHRHGQAWISRDEMKKRWGTLQYYKYYFKLKQAVDDTRGQVLTYDGQLIDPVYHASCGGAGTVSSGEVWQSQIPYLKGVPCPYDADPQPKREATIALDQVESALKTDLSAQVVSTGGAKTAYAVLERTETGRPKTVRIGANTYPATVVRDLLGLRSANFDWEMSENNVKVTTTGYGHGVGMCQYGARGLAEHGYSFDKILKHYYTGVEIIKMSAK